MFSDADKEPRAWMVSYRSLGVFIKSFEINISSVIRRTINKTLLMRVGWSFFIEKLKVNYSFR